MNLNKNGINFDGFIKTNNIYSFSIEADTTYSPGDYFLWAFKTHFLSSDHYNEAYALLSVHFENDSVVGTSQRLSSNRQMEIKLNCPAKLSDVPIRSVNGTIYIPLRDKGFGILAVDNFVLVRYHDLAKPKSVASTSSVAPKDSTASVSAEQDSARTRRNPYDIRNEQNDERTINIVRDKPLKPNRRRR